LDLKKKNKKISFQLIFFTCIYNLKKMLSGVNLMIY